MIKNLIHCPACNQVIPNYQGYVLTQSEILTGVEWSDADLTSARDFLRAHFGHKLEELSVEEDSWVSEKPYYESLRVSYCLAGKGDQKFLIRRTKTALDQPASYEIISGKMEISIVSLTAQEDDLRNQIAHEKGFSPLQKERMEKFIQVFRDEIGKISPDKIGEEIKEINDEDGITLAYAGLNNSRWERILTRCRLYFDKDELKAIRRFIEENCNPPDVLSLQIERRISIIPLSSKESVEGLQDGEETEEEMKTPSIVIFKKGS